MGDFVTRPDLIWPVQGGWAEQACLDLRDHVAGYANVHTYGADPTGVEDSTQAFVDAQAAALAAGGGEIRIPRGTYRVNLTLAGGSYNGIQWRGEGRRTTWLKPAVDAPVFTFDATAGPIINNVIRDCGFTASGTGFASPALLFTGGEGISDWFLCERVYFVGFTDTIKIIGRCEWSRFVDGEVDGDQGTAGVLIDSSAPIYVEFKSWTVRGGTGAGFYARNNSATGDNIILGLAIDDCDAEGNGGHGIYIANADQLSVRHTYIESNGGHGIFIDGPNTPTAHTYARGFQIAGNRSWGNTLDAIRVRSEVAVGFIGDNFLSATDPNATLDIATTSDESHITLGRNFEGGSKIHRITLDGNGRSHVSGISPLRLSAHSALAGDIVAGAIDVRGLGAMRFPLAAPATVSTLTGADPGQVVHLSNAGAGTITLANGAGTDGFVFPSGADVSLTTNKTAAVVYDGTYWRPLTSVAY